MYLTCLSVFDPSGHLRSLWSRDVRKKSKGVKLPPCSKTAHLCPRTVGFHDIIKALHVVNMVYHFHDRDRGRPNIAGIAAASSFASWVRVLSGSANLATLKSEMHLTAPREALHKVPFSQTKSERATKCCCLLNNHEVKSQSQSMRCLSLSVAPRSS